MLYIFHTKYKNATNGHRLIVIRDSRRSRSPTPNCHWQTQEGASLWGHLFWTKQTVMSNDHKHNADRRNTEIVRAQQKNSSNCSKNRDVKRGQNLEAKTRAMRPRSRPWPGLRGRGQGRGQANLRIKSTKWWWTMTTLNIQF